MDRWKGIITGLTLIMLIFSTVLQYGKLHKLTEMQEENRIQSEKISVGVQDLAYSLEDFRESYKSTGDLHSERLSDLNSTILDKHQITSRAIKDSGRTINQSFLEFMIARSREVDSDKSRDRDSLENERILENAFHKGRALYKEKKFSMARDLFFEALTLYPHDREIRFYYLSSLYYAEPENFTNFEYLKEQMILFTYDENYWETSLKILALISLAENDMENAYSYFCTLYEEFETNSSYVRFKGLIEYQTGRYEESLQSFPSYLHSDPGDFEIIYFYGLSLYQLEHYKEALEQFHLAEESDEPYGNLNRKIEETLEKLENS